MRIDMLASASLPQPRAVAIYVHNITRGVAAPHTATSLRCLQPHLPLFMSGCLSRCSGSLHPHSLWSPQRFFATRCCLAPLSTKLNTTRQKHSAKQPVTIKPPVQQSSAEKGSEGPVDHQPEPERASPSSTKSKPASLSAYEASTSLAVMQTQSTVFDEEENKVGVPAPFFDAIPERYKKSGKYRMAADEMPVGNAVLSALNHYRSDTIEQVMDLGIFDKVEELIKIPNINSYDLHTLDSITEDMVSSVKGRKIMYRFVSNEERHSIRRAIHLVQNEFKGRLMGASLYLRIVHPCDVAARAARPEGNTKDSATRASKGDVPSVASTPSQPSKAQNQQYLSEVKRIRDGIEHVLRRYVNRLLEPFPNELAIDLTHYRTFLALLNVSRRNVEQLLKDAEDYMARRPVNPKGIPAGPPPPEDLEPISPDVLAAEIARLIRCEVLQPICDSVDPRDQHLNGGRADSLSAFANTPRVCIGVASSPVLAKMACDAEVAAVLKRLEDLVEREKGEMPHKKDDEKVPLISVRSLFRHTKSLKEICEFMSTIPVSQVPLFSPPFVDLLREVFAIRTCEDLYVHQNMLCFCLSPKTFHLCYAVACGCMQFPIEETVALKAIRNLHSTCSAVRVLSSNMISIVNAERTKFAISIENITRDTFTAKIGGAYISMFVYGRLTTDEDLVQTVLDVVSKDYTKMHRDGVTCGGFRCSIAEGSVMSYSFEVVFEHFLPRHEVLRAVKTQLQPLLQHRKRGGVDAEGLSCTVTLSYNRAKFIAMIPPAMLEDAEDLKEGVLQLKLRIKRCKWVVEERQRAEKVMNQQLGVVPMQRKRAPIKQKTAPSDVKIDEVVVV
ncbi:hypothetical protein ABL78_2026 [Leptomonas seymouri]|uniref:Uncharacterized protein n=1 Tax=Leptomonas seymouri TaxID=5684 RepID=A0A0N1I1D3_LEPSE|nr:hypothetical protein ABL78_2026 [Leptomonas seymouri]|eukprot:KPI88832.1 hypothetical protein ABL78_2026 [Leptomonas seymouri]